jgi:exodeoxyribonuclease VII large subunit
MRETGKQKLNPMSVPLLPPGIKVLSVSELTREVKSILEDAFGSVWVAGELSNCRPQTSGHLYPDLKDGNAKLSAAIWRTTLSRLRFEPRDGLKVIVRGRLDVYPPHGTYKLIIDELYPKGIGALELAFQQLSEKLAQKGYFDPARRRPLPRVPKRIVLVTSPTGAAVRDMLETLGRRWTAVDLWICPVPVQGVGAGEKIARAIRFLNRLEGIDILILARGGGSLEDLWAFNEECVADAIFGSRIPVVTGVGHETDFTIADKVADVRAETPTAAAVRAVPDREELCRQVLGLETRLANRVKGYVKEAHQRLCDLRDRRCFRLPLDRIRDLEARLDETGDRLTRAARLGLQRANQHIEAVAARLETLSPLNVLARGYSLTRKEDDQSVVRRSDQVRPGERIVTLVQSGRLISRVEEASAASADGHG